MLKEFFLFCSGINTTLLKRTPIETNKYIGMGATIFFTGVFAAIAAGYAAYTIFDSTIAAIVLAAFWGLMIFNLDRYIVSTMRKQDSFWSNFFSATPRILLAMLIAVVIAKPLELKIFETEIESELAIIQQEKYQEQDNVVQARYQSGIDSLQSQVTLWKNDMDQKKAERDALVAAAIAEADGTGGSMQRNLGPIYKTKKAAADQAQKELDEISSTNLALIDAHQTLINRKQEQMNSDLDGQRRIALTGFAARLEGLERAADKSEAIRLASLFIMLLFMAIELAPIITKLITKRGPYDMKLAQHEMRYMEAYENNVAKVKAALKNQADFDQETQSHKLKAAIQAEKQIADMAMQQRIEQLKQHPALWSEYINKGKILDV